MDFEVYKNAIMKPVETFAKEKKNASTTGGLKNYVIGAVLAGIVGAIFSFGLGLLAIPFVVVAALIGGFIGAGIMHFIAKALGGKGEFTPFYYLTSLYYVVIAPLSAIPVVGVLAGLYSLYLLFLALKGNYALSTGKAVAVIVIVLVIVFVVATVMALLFGVALGAAAIAGIGAMGN